MVRVGDRDLSGHTLNVSAAGLHLRIPLSATADTPLPAVGTDVSFRLLLPYQLQPLYGEGTVVWSKAGEANEHEPAVQLGVTLFEVDAVRPNRLSEFLANFRYTLVVLEEETADLELVRQALESDYRIVTCSSPALALQFIEENDPAAILIGEPLAQDSVSEFLDRCAALVAPPVARIIGSKRDPTVVLHTAGGFPNAFYWLQKPYRASALQQVVRRGIEAYALALDNERLALELERTNDRLQRENSYLRRKLEPLETFEGIVGTSPELRHALAELQAARRSTSTVHIQGETGTGKELVARALHFGGPRGSGPFIAQNCAGMTESLLQSTLFGHRKGAFTGADRDHQGVFEQASGGTLFLDEVAELSRVVQSALLRALETGAVTPIGATTAVAVDVRLVSATHRDLREEARAGRFREDLLFRMLVVPVHLPALRERSGDTVLLANHFLRVHAQHHGKQLPELSREVLDAFARYRWPGNVRELENEVERLVVLAEDRQPIPLRLLSAHVREGAAAAASDPRADSEAIFIPAGMPYDAAIALLQRSLVTRALDDADGRLAVAAQLLDLERSRLGKLRRRLGLDAR